MKNKNLKISTMVDQAVWTALKSLCEEGHQNLSGMLTEALQEFVQRKRLRPTFLKHAEDSIRDNEALGHLLSK